MGKFNIDIIIDFDECLSIGAQKQTKSKTIGEHLLDIRNQLLKETSHSNNPSSDADVDISNFLNELIQEKENIYILHNDLITRFNKNKPVNQSDCLDFVICLGEKYNFLTLDIKTEYDSEEYNYALRLKRINILNNLKASMIPESFAELTSGYDFDFHFYNSISDKIDAENERTASDVSKKNELKLKKSELMKLLWKVIQKTPKLLHQEKWSREENLNLNFVYYFYKDLIWHWKDKYANKKEDNEELLPKIVKLEEKKSGDEVHFIVKIPENQDSSNIFNLQKGKRYLLNNESEKIIEFELADIKNSVKEIYYINSIQRIQDRNNKIIENSEKEVQSLQQKIDELSPEENKLNNELHSLERMIKDLNELKRKLDEDNNQKKYELRRGSTDDSRYAYINSQINNNNQQIKYHSNKIKELDDKKKDLEKRKQVLKGEIDKIENSIWQKKSIIWKCEENNKEIEKSLIKNEENQFFKFKIKKDKINNSNSNNSYTQMEGVLTDFWDICEKEVFKEPTEDQFLKITEKLISLPKIFETNNEFWLSDQDDGLMTKHKRFYNNLKNFAKGDYQNPFLSYFIEKPGKFTINSQALEDIKLCLHDDNPLNDLQLKAAKKALISPCISFLQGPPGTGKTQTIVALIYHIIKKEKKNVVLTSSTHEAILNAFDRIASLTEDDPNFIFYKTLKKVDDKDDKKNKTNDNEKLEKRFDIRNTFFNFCNASINYYSSKHLKNTTKDEFKGLMNKINDVIKPSNFQINKKLIEFISELEKTSNLKNISGTDEEKRQQIVKFFNKDKDSFPNFIKEHFDKEYEIITLDDIEYYFKKIQESLSERNRIDHLFHRMKSLLEHLLKNERINKIYSQIKNDENVWSEISPDNNSKNKDKIIKKLELIQKNLEENCNDKVNKNIKDSFNLYVFKEKLINLIGLTTTAKQEIKYDSENQINLFQEYPVYMSIVDEVSKCNSFEIISSSLLAEKIVLAGDYKQLPPITDFEQTNDKNNLTKKIDEDDVEDIEINKIFNKFPLIKEVYDRYEWDDDEEEDIDDDDDETCWYKNKNSIEKLTHQIKYPFFKKHVLNLKKWGYEHTFYTFLKQQRRFNKEIQSVVNCFYDEYEKLSTDNEARTEFYITYKLARKEKKSIVAYDTSIVSNDWKRRLIELVNQGIVDHKIIGTLEQRGNVAFDQKETLDKQKTYSARINEYNAFTIAEIIADIVESNSSDDKPFDLANIGVISMTRAQKEIIKSYWNKIKERVHNKTINKIKVDTVDNFQGREKEIIIIDFVRAKGSLENAELRYPEKRNYDFYSVPERFNVAVSRAKQTLILVGAFKEPLEHIELDGEYASLISDYIECFKNKDAYIDLGEKYGERN
ncbi:AAA domain-containing protein [Ureaplasma zalophigenitalium]|uniref:AAA domain-containing protein n=1 Tax=Ureaplasma zalophigenitalium TaxID=907723 RepID=A0ABT3BPM1_9BACT|nr:AAA domain-containing protein [Ureaplasma zalophigenitalium]MCV3754062.1 AAA domain-containing protein [Ureaplasma zalophigenitalium]